MGTTSVFWSPNCSVISDVGFSLKHMCLALQACANDTISIWLIARTCTQVLGPHPPPYHPTKYILYEKKLDGFSHFVQDTLDPNSRVCFEAASAPRQDPRTIWTPDLRGSPRPWNTHRHRRPSWRRWTPRPAPSTSWPRRHSPSNIPQCGSSQPRGRTRKREGAVACVAGSHK